MSLSGKLEVFPLEEVLRLLARSHQNGCLRVDSVPGSRVYLEGGSLTLASAESDEEFRAQLIASGLASDEALGRLAASRGSLADALVPSASGSALGELVREHTVESLYRIRRPGAGNFQFEVEERPRYATGQSFDVEAIISDADRRASEWSDIEAVVPDLDVDWRMVPTIDEESVNLSDTAWRFLAALDGSCSVHALAGRLGLTTFQTARRMAELSRARLVEGVPSAARSETAPVDSPSPAQVGAQSDTPGESSEPAADRSWWEQENATDQEVATEAKPGDEEAAESGDNFLESVFAELDRSDQPTEEGPEPDDPQGEDEGEGEGEGEEGGFGLLRRRGLGAAFRELADS